jgi:hypothetical protein
VTGATKDGTYLKYVSEFRARQDLRQVMHTVRQDRPRQGKIWAGRIWAAGRIDLPHAVREDGRARVPARYKGGSDSELAHDEGYGHALPRARCVEPVQDAATHASRQHPASEPRAAQTGAPPPRQSLARGQPESDYASPGAPLLDLNHDRERRDRESRSHRHVRASAARTEADATRVDEAPPMGRAKSERVNDTSCLILRPRYISDRPVSSLDDHAPRHRRRAQQTAAERVAAVGAPPPVGHSLYGLGSRPPHEGMGPAVKPTAVATVGAPLHVAASLYGRAHQYIQPEKPWKKHAHARRGNAAYVAGSTTPLVIPKNYNAALASPEAAHWQAAMDEHSATHVEHGTFKEVQVPLHMKVLPCRWVFSVKTDGEGKVIRFKARTVIWGNLQQPGIDFQETFSPTVRGEQVRTLLAIGTQLYGKRRTGSRIDVAVLGINDVLSVGDVRDAYLNSPLDEDGVYTRSLRRATCRRPPQPPASR